MREDVKGTTLVDREVRASGAVLESLGAAIGTASAAATATLVPFFGATAGGRSSVVDGLGLDLSRALLAGVGYQWHRAFVPDEQVWLRVAVEDIYTKGSNTFAVVVAEFTDLDGGPVQRQSITFVERGGRA